MPKAMKSAMNSTLRAILDGEVRDEVDKNLSALITKGITGELGEDLLMMGKLKKRLTEYRVLSGASAGALWAKETLGRDYVVDEAFFTAVDERGKHIAFDKIEQLEGVTKIDWHEMTEKFIVKKASDIYDLVGWDTVELTNAHRGLGAVEWV